MLIKSHRHTKEDLRLWQEHEAADLIHSQSLDRKIALAIGCIQEFASRGDCYCGVSWGKDSAVVAHLCRVVSHSIPLLHLRPSNHNPDCDAVREAYFQSFPGQEYTEVPVDYSDLHAQSLPHQVLDKETDKRWFAAIRRSGKKWGGRHILGIRSEESNGRKIRELVHGENSKTGSAPITKWSTSDVFAYLARYDLPVHPAYAMLGSGRWQRNRLRVAEIGDTHGTGGGRREWEQEYYGDVLNRVAACR